MYEMIQYLLLAGSALDNERNTFTDIFRDRLQSFLDQIPRPAGAGAAPSREGFFQGFFLGMFGSIRDINISNTSRVEGNNRRDIDLRLGIDQVGFRLNQEGVLDIGVRYTHNGEQVFSRFAFSADGDIRRASTRRDLSFRINIDTGGGNPPLNADVFGPGQNPLNFYGHGHLETGQRPMNLQGMLLGMSAVGGNERDRGVARGHVGSFFDYVTNLYQRLRDLLRDDLFNEEAFQHGFLVGVLMNYRHRLNLRPSVEVISGRGYADLILLTRGDQRSYESVPIVVELKRQSQPRGGRLTQVQLALEEAKWYFRFLFKNKVRMLHSVNYAHCVGLDMSRGRHLVNTVPIADHSSPLFRRFINLAANARDEVEVIGEDGRRSRLEGHAGIRAIIGGAYYGFPFTQQTYNHLSRFFLGQAIVTNELGNGTKLCTHIAHVGAHTTTFLIVVGRSPARLVVLNIMEGGRHLNFNRNLPRLSSGLLSGLSNQNGGITEISEISVYGYTHTVAHGGSPSPRRFFEGSIYRY